MSWKNQLYPEVPKSDARHARPAYIVSILELPSDEAPEVWYHNPAYQATFQGDWPILLRFCKRVGAFTSCWRQVAYRPPVASGFTETFT
jgi:hypothetical protein